MRSKLVRFSKKELLTFCIAHKACAPGLKDLKRYLKKHTAREAIAKYLRCRKIVEASEIAKPLNLSHEDYNRSNNFLWLCRKLYIAEQDVYDFYSFCGHLTVEQVVREIKVAMNDWQFP